VTGVVPIKAGDVVTLSPGSSAFKNGVLTIYVVSGSTNVAKVSFVDSTTWALTGSLTTARASHTATLLSGGTVLAAGGYDNVNYFASAEVFDPAAGTWNPTGSLQTSRASHTANSLSNGKVMVVGGSSEFDFYLSSAEIYDPAPKSTIDSIPSRYVRRRGTRGRNA
jgi:hypothetical protein